MSDAQPIAAPRDAATVAPRRAPRALSTAPVPDAPHARPARAGEVIEFRWDTPRRFLDDHARGAIKLPPPTLWHLTDLAPCATVDDALAWARARTVIPVRP